jgi:hypothetical protein
VDDVKRFAVRRTRVRTKKGTATRGIQHVMLCACVCTMRLLISIEASKDQRGVARTS